jgi:hypothetical protein
MFRHLKSARAGGKRPVCFLKRWILWAQA